MRGPPRRALVIGGGVAGLAAAFALRERGVAVELLESRSRLGGRVFSFDDRRLARTLDNGPHVMLGCYRHMRRLLRRIGSEQGFERPAALRLAYRQRDGTATALRLSPLPPALALPPALLGWSALAFGARLRALRGAVAALLGAPVDWTLEEWLQRRGQHGAPRDFLWDPLCLAVMNADAHEVSAALFLRTVRRAFSSSAAAAAIWIPARPWGALIDAPAQHALAAAGVTVRLHSRVTAVAIEDGRVRSLTVGEAPRPLSEEEVVVFALPWRPFSQLVSCHLAPVGTFAARSIVNVYFDCGAAAPLPDDGRLVALVGGRPFQFVYRTPDDAPGRFALIASASSELEGLTTEAVAQRAREQLAHYYPGAVLPADATWRVTKEAAATLLADPGTCRLRPRPGPIDGLSNALVCGDWTQTYLPSTLEGAAESGHRVAAAL